MRLICPNCGAQYEVPQEAIPETGRDVECSNCGDTWFAGPDRPGAPPRPDQPATATGPDTSPEAEPPAVEPSRPAAPPEADPDAYDETYEDPDPVPAETPVATPRPRRRELDPQVASVLQAERDLAARRRAAREAETFESQPTLALDEAEPARNRRRERLAEAFGTEPEPTPAAETETERPAEPPAQPGGPEPETPEPPSPEPDVTEPAAGASATAPEAPRPEAEAIPAGESHGETPGAAETGPPATRPQTPAERAAAAEGLQRRELLPDIDTVNSELRSGTGPGAAETGNPAPERGRSGFRIGFAGVLLLAALMTLLYSQADAVAERLPRAAPALEDYVETVNSLRLWLDLRLQELLTRLETLAQE